MALYNALKTVKIKILRIKYTTEPHVKTTNQMHA